MTKAVISESIVETVENFAKRAEALLPVHPSLFSGLGGLSLLYSNLFLYARDDQHSKNAIK